jgi:hypothetical protein
MVHVTLPNWSQPRMPRKACCAPHEVTNNKVEPGNITGVIPTNQASIIASAEFAQNISQIAERIGRSF